MQNIKNKQNTTLLIVTEKLEPLKNIFKFIQNETIENYFSKYDKIEIITTYGFGMVRFDYPSNKKYNEYPLTKDIETKFNHNLNIFDNKQFLYNSYSLKTDFILSKNEEKNIIVRNKESDFLNNKIDYDDIFILSDPDYAGAFYTNQVISFIYGDNWRNKFNNVYHNLNCYTLSYDKVEQELKKIFSIENFNHEKYNEFLRRANVKYYFDYNYNLNSLVFIKEIFKELDINYKNKNSHEKNIYNQIQIDYFSKYTTMAFMVIYEYITQKNEENKFVNISNIYKKMYNWKGTGKYNEFKNSNFGIGSPASVNSIVNHLFNFGLLEEIKIKNKPNNVILTEKAHQLKNMFVKKMYDPDLNFRINKWCENENQEESFKQMDNYLLYMFGKQKIKNKKTIIKTKPIKNEIEYNKMLKRVEELMEINPKLNDKLGNELENLAKLIEDYEDIHYPIS